MRKAQLTASHFQKLTFNLAFVVIHTDKVNFKIEKRNLLSQNFDISKNS